MFSNKSVSPVLVVAVVALAGCGPIGDIPSLLGGGSGSTSQAKAVKDFLEDQGIDTSSMDDTTKLEPTDLTEEEKRAALDAANGAASSGFVNTPIRTNR